MASLILIIIDIIIIILFVLNRFFFTNRGKKIQPKSFQEDQKHVSNPPRSVKNSMIQEKETYVGSPSLSSTQGIVSTPDITTDTTYNTLDNYNDSIHFQVSPERAHALEMQVSRCEGPFPLMNPEKLGKKQKYNCKSYTCRGGYDANKWD
uniref:Uncharacterized protein n=1 Tax=viral metagenome TaxID=1070528 RepID=A0A6C0CYW5_9ZZZZ